METKFKIGDFAYHARIGTKVIDVICPDCGGTKFFKAVLFDGSEHTIECAGCKSGWQQPSGRVQETVWDAPVIEYGRICGLEINGDKVSYKFSYFSAEENEIFSTVEAAEIRSKEISDEYISRQRDIKLSQKENTRRTWSWHVHYYRRQIRDAEKTIIRATEMLNIARSHTKEEKANG